MCNLFWIVNIIFFLVVLFNLVKIIFEIFVIFLNECVCESVFWLVVVFKYNKVLWGVLGIVWLIICFILFNFCIKLDLFCKCFVVL